MNCITVVILKSVGWVFSLILPLPWEVTTLRGKRPLLSTWACFCFPLWPKQDAVTAPQAWFFTMSASPRALSSVGEFTRTIELLSAPAQSHRRVQLCDPMCCSPPGSSVRGISQARMEWVAIPFSREIKDIKNKISHRVSSLTECCLTLWIWVSGSFLRFGEFGGHYFFKSTFCPLLFWKYHHRLVHQVCPISTLGSTLFFFPLCFSDWIISKDQFVDSSAWSSRLFNPSSEFCHLIILQHQNLFGSSI